MSRQGVNTTQKGCCNACDKPIVGQVITALGKTWHPEHFTCNHCNQELGTRNFFERDGHPYCEPDYHNLFSPRCAYCNGAILDVWFFIWYLHAYDDQFDGIYQLLNNLFYSIYRNVSPLWTRLGTQSTFSVPNVVNNLVKTVSMNAMASHIVATIISICSHQNAMAAIVPLWKITFRLWTRNGIRTALFAE